jgi:hypothetical protein
VAGVQACLEVPPSVASGVQVGPSQGGGGSRPGVGRRPTRRGAAWRPRSRTAGQALSHGSGLVDDGSHPGRRGRPPGPSAPPARGGRWPRQGCRAANSVIEDSMTSAMSRAAEAVSVPRQAYSRSPGSMPPNPASSSRPHSYAPASSWPKVRGTTSSTRGRRPHRRTAAAARRRPSGRPPAQAAEVRTRGLDLLGSDVDAGRPHPGKRGAEDSRHPAHSAADVQQAGTRCPGRATKDQAVPPELGLCDLPTLLNGRLAMNVMLVQSPRNFRPERSDRSVRGASAGGV